jgi:hypothetical protein
VRGYLYGEKHTTRQANTVRQKAFDALLRQERSVGRYDDDNDLWTFDRDDVYAFAGVLLPTAAAVLAEADRRRQKRVEAERLRRELEQWSRVADVARTFQDDERASHSAIRGS